MSKDIEKQLNAITDNLKAELLAAKAIDEQGKTINIEKFNEILDKKIEQLNKIVATTEKDGVTTNRYDANLAFGRVDFIEKIKKSGTIDPYSKWIEREEPGIKSTRAEKTQKTNALNAGIKKLMAKMRSAFTKKPEHDR